MTDNEAGSLAGARAAIAAEVRAELARQGRTQRQVADVLGLSAAAVGQRLIGRTPFRAEELVLIAVDLGIPAELFLDTPVTEAGAA